ncbi:Substance-K receptor [Stylophora pistillata]|uniref:Substance-K receptor n=1 Tax=Stylophora pistillata TaxID=50429 RepID=A0A2B4SC76_STYPI|nr:Substance-K receptor [Stylophora pistillata]
MKAMNNTSYLNTSFGGEEPNDEHSAENLKEVNRIIIIGAYALICLFSLVGNSLILHIVRTRNSIRKNAFNWLLFNTAVADLLDVTTSTAFSLPVYFCEECWISGVAGSVLCKLTPFLSITSICASIWTLTVIAADRYLAIVCIRRRPLSPRSVMRSIVIVWLFASLISSGELHKHKLIEEGGKYSVCTVKWHENEELAQTFEEADMIGKVVIAYAIPLFIMAVLYSSIAFFLWKQRPPGTVNQEAYTRQKKKRKEIIKMLLMAVTVFAICWLPVHVAHMMLIFYSDIYNSIPHVVQGLFFWFAHANAAIHPWLFIAFSENLRSESELPLMLNVFDADYELQYSESYSSTHQEATIEEYQYCCPLQRAFESLIAENYTNFV